MTKKINKNKKKKAEKQTTDDQYSYFTAAV
jgi:hypothetical protein